MRIRFVKAAAALMAALLLLCMTLGVAHGLLCARHTSCHVCAVIQQQRISMKLLYLAMLFVCITAFHSAVYTVLASSGSAAASPVELYCRLNN